MLLSHTWHSSTRDGIEMKAPFHPGFQGPSFLPSYYSPILDSPLPTCQEAKKDNIEDSAQVAQRPCL